MKDPKQITLRDIFYETDNVTERRRMIEAIGWERLVKIAGPAVRVVRESSRGILYEILLPDDPDYFLKVVKVVCPSTGHVYHLRVPPSIADPDEAIAWGFNLSVEDYKPIKET